MKLSIETCTVMEMLMHIDAHGEIERGVFDGYVCRRSCEHLLSK
jgi:hypothetical protein